MKQSDLFYLALLVIVITAVGTLFFTQRNVILSLFQNKPTPIPTAMPVNKSPSAGFEKTTENSVPGLNAAAPDSVSPVQLYTINATNYAFDPAEIHASKGDTLTVTFTSKEGTHDWNLDEFNAHTQKHQAGEDETITFPIDKSGTFEFYSSVGTDRSKGMVGKLIITP